MASGPQFENPNEVEINDDRQVMSPRAPPTATLVNGVANTPFLVGSMDMDGETVQTGTASLPVDGIQTSTAPTMRVGQISEAAPGASNPDPVNNGLSSPNTLAGSFLLGPNSAGSNVEPPMPAATSSTSGGRRGPPAFLSGVAKAVQAIPAAVEGLVMGHPPVIRGTGSTDQEGYASAQSGTSPDGMRRLPTDRFAPNSPLLDERTLRTLSGHQAVAPHLYSPEAPPLGGEAFVHRL